MRTPHTSHLPTRRPLAAIALLLVASSATLALAAGCGGGSSAPAESTQGSPPAAAAAPPAAGEPATGDAAVPAGDLGARVFEQRCVLCHGKAGTGDGVAAVGLDPKPRNLRDAAYMSTRTDDQLLEIIRDGKGAMPAWGKNNTLSEDEIQAVLKHIRTFTSGS